jgi:hypothetical protein
MYTQGVQLITNITATIKETSIAGASSSDTAMLMAVKELTSEIRGLREAYMHVVSILGTCEEILQLTFSNSMLLSLQRMKKFRNAFDGTSHLPCRDLGGRLVV